MPLADFKNAQLPDWNKGIPVGRGMLHSLIYAYSAPSLVVNDQIQVEGRVPADEHWYVLQWTIADETGPGGLGNGWKVQSLSLDLSGWLVLPSGPPIEDTFALGTMVWNRFWDGVNYLTWDAGATVGFPDYSPLIVRCSDPTWSMARWPAGTRWINFTIGAEFASAIPSLFRVEMVVLRFRKEDYDFKRLSQEEGAIETLANDLHMAAHRPLLGQ